MSDEPIFIVGVPRSGTTLLAAMLAAHSRLSCGPETHFFRRLSEVDAGRLCDPAAWPRPAADFVCSIRHTAFVPGTERTLLQKYGIDESSITAYLHTQSPSVPAILRSVTEQYMRAKGKERWAEKTPDHLLQVASIREHFPSSPVIRAVRDPRDVALSLMKVPWGVQSFLEGLLHWLRLDGSSREFLDGDDLTCTIRFEDLVTSPGEELRRVCAFIGEVFEEGMLDTSKTGAALNSRDVPWKSKVSQAVDVSRVAAWRNELTRSENRLAEALLGDRLAELGYPTDETFSRAGELHPRSGLTAEHATPLTWLASRGVRLWKAAPDEPSRAKIYVGEPGGPAWLGRQKAERLLNVLPVLADVARAAVHSSDLYWIPGQDDGKWAGFVSFVLRLFLSPYKVAVDPRSPAES